MGPVTPLRGSMQPVSRRSFFILEIVERPTFHFMAAFRSLNPLSQSSNMRRRISVGIGFIRDRLGE